MMWLFLLMVVFSIIILIINFCVTCTLLKRQLKADASRVCKRLSVVMNQNIWELNSDAMKQYFTKYPWDLMEIASVKILTEFDDVIYQNNFNTTVDNLVKCRQPVYRQGKVIGYIEVAMDKSKLLSTQISIFVTWATTIIISIIAVLLTLYIVTKKLIVNPVNILTDGLNEIAKGNYHYRIPIVDNSSEAFLISNMVNSMSEEVEKRKEMLAQEIKTRKEAERKLQEFSTHLEEEVKSRTRSLQKAYTTLLQETKDRQRLQREILGISDRERQRIGIDIHDSLGQKLTGVSLLLSVLAKTLEKNGASETDLAKALQLQMKEVIKEARAISHGLSPLRIGDDGLLSSICNLAQDTEGHLNISCKVKNNKFVNIFDENKAMHIYRIIQEAINNAQKHGKAKNINIILQQDAASDNMGEILIEDDGIGIDDKAKSSDGIGIRILKFRAAAIGGALDIFTNHFGGTTVRITYKSN